MVNDSGFSEEDIILYTTGNCHLLSWYVHQKIKYCNYHDFSDEYGIYLLKHEGVVIHSLVYHDGSYFDITGRYEIPEEIYDYWASCYEEYEGHNKHFFSLEPMENLTDLELESYTDAEREKAQSFVKHNIRKFLHFD